MAIKVPPPTTPEPIPIPVPVPRPEPIPREAEVLTDVALPDAMPVPAPLPRSRAQAIQLKIYSSHNTTELEDLVNDFLLTVPSDLTTVEVGFSPMGPGASPLYFAAITYNLPAAEGA